MKRHSTVIAFTVMFFGMATMAFAENVNVQTAQRAAQSFLNSKMEGTPQIHLIDFAEKSSFPNFYVFGNERCFVIIAADDCVHPVLGYSTENAFGTDEMPEEILGWLMRYEDAVAFVVLSKAHYTNEIRDEWNRLLGGKGLDSKSRNSVNPLIRTRWTHKKTPFNNLCPEDDSAANGRCVGGCGSVAMAQLMKYYEHPINGVGSHSYTPQNHPEYGVQSANFGNTTYEWDNMKNVYSKGYTNEEADAVATLIYHCGVSVNINYGPIASGTIPNKIDTVLWTYFDYSPNAKYRSKANYTDAQWISMLKNDLNLERPVIYRGKNQQTGVGHLFICDGYDENDFFHFNLGWNGGYDGYYAIGSIHPSYDMNYLNGAVFNCYPNTPSITPPSSVTTAVNNREVTINWSSVSDATSYRLYRDGDLIADNLVNRVFVDQNVTYGEHFYYVKSVKSDGTMSLKSISSYVTIRFSGPTPTNLLGTVYGNSVALSWETPNTSSVILQYGTGIPEDSAAGNTSVPTYWAHRYPVSTLCNYAGKAIDKVSFYCKRLGAYTLSIHKGDATNTSELVHQQDYIATVNGWQDVVFTPPISIDFTQDLWIVFSSDLYHPASYCLYSGSNVGDASLYGSTGNSWTSLNNRSWLMKTYLTDGTYTYNLYRNGEAVATNLNDNTYTDTNLPDGIYDYHVTTNYFGGESDPSNTVHVQIGELSSQTVSFTPGWNWFSTCVEITLDDLKAALVSALPGTRIVIKSKNNGTATYNGRRWKGQLSSLEVSQMYMIGVSAACEITLEGEPINPAEHPITITRGDNWIGYPLSESMTLRRAFGRFPVNGDVVKSRGDGAAKFNGTRWRGSLHTLESGQGYIYKSNATGSRVFIYPSAK